MKVRVISDVIATVGESPIYNHKTNIVVWVDILGKKWHRCNLTSGITVTQTVPSMIGAIVERLGGTYFAAVKEGFAELGGKNAYESMINFLSEDERMNDAKADPYGNWWVGSNAINFSNGKGKLYRLRPDRSFEIVISDLTLPNGIGWSPDYKKFYLIDSLQYCLWIFDFEGDTGALTNQELLYRFPKDGGIPDGLCVAADGSILVAMWDGWRIEVISNSGILCEPLNLPVQRPTSCIFAGSQGTELVITTAAHELDLVGQPCSGKLLSITDSGFQGVGSLKYFG
jgi:sugar lactone lactonase YvrE